MERLENKREGESERGTQAQQTRGKHKRATLGSDVRDHNTVSLQWMLSSDSHDLPIYLLNSSSTAPMPVRCILRLHPSAPSEPALVHGAAADEPVTWDALVGVPFAGDERVPRLVKTREAIVASIAEQR